ncbi:hypothetical protein [Petrotoga olearia]|uniref:Uncharacterized protein n=2 Tax=Petrotoga olearia TaxID=156203 RepID=A0A2K1P4P8_9BACT|nr:hypothetical protein [Petrotoga olearia]PNR97726.1 hypothetical protein X929_01960 [Petrotoga olearia DSM 13574]RMA75275.1 hypothetical protein C8D75_0794 [Petrotoga olearia]
MGGLRIEVDEEFINGLIDKVIEENTQVQGLKNLNVQLREDGINFQMEVNFLGKDSTVESLIKVLEKPEDLENGKLRLSLSGDEGVRKILEGIFYIFSEFTKAVSSKDYEILIDFNKVKINPFIDTLLKSVKISRFFLQDGKFELVLEFKK